MNIKRLIAVIAAGAICIGTVAANVLLQVLAIPMVYDIQIQCKGLETYRRFPDF